MRQTVARIECNGCGARIEAIDTKRRQPPAVQAVADEAEACGWWRDSGADWCPSCKRSAKLAAEDMLIEAGSAAYEQGGQAWADWNAKALNFDEEA